MMDPLSTIGSAEARIRALEMRIQELEALSNDAFDLSVAAPLPSVQLSPPETPQMEVFGGSGGGIFPGPLQIVQEEGAIYLVQKWCKVDGSFYKFVDLQDEQLLDVDFEQFAGPNATTQYATRIRLFSHATDHAEGIVKSWEDTQTESSNNG